MAHPSSDAPFLIIGGTGTVGSRVASVLQSTGNNVLIASRSARPQDVDSSNNSRVKFDWFDDSTYSNAFSHPLATASGGLRGAFLIAPPSLDMVSAMKSFIDLLRSKGVRRFVLLSATSIAKGDPILTGLIHEYLDQLGEAGQVEWAVLRPTWFMNNFVSHKARFESSPEGSFVYSATGQGRIPFVAADDIAASATQLLTAAEPPNADFLILGPESLTYSDVASILSDVLQKPVAHKDLSAAEMQLRFQEFGVPEEYAAVLGAMETAIKNGSEDRTNGAVLSLTGRPPKTFREWAGEVKSALGV